MFPFLRLGPFLLQMPGLALLGGLWLGSSLAEKEAVRLKLNPAVVYNLIFYGLVAGIIGARLAYAVQYLDVYLDNPWSLLALTPSTLSLKAGLAVGVATAVLFGRHSRLPLRPTLDALAPGLAALLVALGVAHIFSGNAFGAPTKLPWAVSLWDEYRHPTQVYETVLALAILILAWKRPPGRPGEGFNFLFVLASSAAARVFLEAFRGDSVIWPGGFRAAQVMGLLVLAVCLWLARAWGQPAAPLHEEGV